MTMANKEQIQKIYDGMGNILSYLYGRWLDEHEFEDFGEYSKVMEKTLKELDPSVVFVRANKKPFGCMCHINNTTIILTITVKNYKCYSY